MQVIVADNQPIFSAGITRALMPEHAIRVVAQCTDLKQLHETVGALRRSIVVFPSSLTGDVHRLLGWIELAASRSVMVLEHDAVLEEGVAKRLAGVLLRSVAAPQLIDCLYRVASGERYMQHAVLKAMPLSDHVGAKAVRRLTPKELQIVALISEGCKNKEIADQLGTKEQVVKNYLRSIYGKTGVSDRLELALFTLHHHAMAEVVEATRLSLSRSA